MPLSCGKPFMNTAKPTKVAVHAARTVPYPEGIEVKIEGDQDSDAVRGMLSQMPVSPFMVVPSGHLGTSSPSDEEDEAEPRAESAGGRSSSGDHWRTIGPKLGASSSVAEEEDLLCHRADPDSAFGTPKSESAPRAALLGGDGESLLESEDEGLLSKRTEPGLSALGIPTSSL